MRRQANRKDQHILFTGDFGAVPASSCVFDYEDASDRKAPRSSVSGGDLIFTPHGHEYLSAWGWVCNIAFPINWCSNPIASVRPQKWCNVEWFRRRRCEATSEFCTHVFKLGLA
jgi:hypothetical protein